MGIMYLPPPKYKCSKCGSENSEKYSRPAFGKSGTYEGVKCRACGHFVEHYKMSIWEQETQSGISYSYDPNKPKSF